MSINYNGKEEKEANEKIEVVQIWASTNSTSTLGNHEDDCDLISSTLPISIPDFSPFNQSHKLHLTFLSLNFIL